MAERRSETMSCRIHDQEHYKYYCKQCKECICPQCIEKLHEDHMFCGLKSAENDIRNDLNEVIEDCKTIEGLKRTLMEINEDLGTDKTQLVS